MHHAHGPHVLFTGLSLLVAVLGSWTALDLFRRVRSHIGQARAMWLGAAAIAMGLSIWSMHFIAMLGFDPGGPVSYDVPLTLLSLALAVAATSGAFFAAAREQASPRRLVLAGAAMGVGICAMHYMGMAALRSAVSLGYRTEYVTASVVIAVTAATAALLAAQRERSLAWRALASLILGVAIVGMHYTAMAGLVLTTVSGGAPPEPGASPFAVGMAVTAGTLAILMLASLAAVYDQRLNVLAALEAGRIGYWELTLPDRRLHISGRGKQIFGWEPQDTVTHQDLLALIAPGDRPTRDAQFSRAVEEGAEYDAEYRIASRQGPRWVHIRGRVVGRTSGRPRRVAGVVLDVTDRNEAFAAIAEADRRHVVMIDELNHRVKNTLATVQSIARQTARRAASPEAFSDAFEARIMALSHAHNALTRSRWEGAGLREILMQELSPYAVEQVKLEGEDVMLEPRQVLALGMVFHELATNAAKHGALSVPGGCVEIAWRTEGAPRDLILDWRESDGPPVTAPSRRGFGSRLIQSTMGEMTGAADIAYAPDGLVCRLTVPL